MHACTKPIEAEMWLSMLVLRSFLPFSAFDMQLGGDDVVRCSGAGEDTSRPQAQAAALCTDSAGQLRSGRLVKRTVMLDRHHACI